MTSEEAPACPYARALKDSVEELPGLAELQACPAFQNECPFKGLAADQVAEKLRQIPPSHLEDNGTFHKTLEFFHRHQQSPTAGCPVKHALPGDWSFDRAMEEFSLASIMGHLAREWEVTQDGESSSSDDEASTKLAPPPDQSGTTSLSQALKSGTARAHEAAESVHFVKNFIRGKIDRNLYALLVAQLFHVYTKLEEALDEHAPSHFANCHFPKQLQRKEALLEDVEFWHTTSSPCVSPTTQDYLDRLEQIAKNNPLLLLSHAYTRYMGDLSGGKVLARVARRALNLTADDAGLAFYHFEHVQSFKLFKDQYRASLNALKLTEEQISGLVQEANVAFLLNMRLFEELDVIDNVPGASIRPLKDVYRPMTPSKNAPSNAEMECPFLKTSNKKKEGVCPWPFILLHDPQVGMKQWQTWLVIGLLAAYIYQTFP